MGRRPNRHPSWLAWPDARQLIDDSVEVLDRRTSSTPLAPAGESKALTEAVGEFGARDWAKRNFGAGIVEVPPIKRANGDPVLDQLFKTNDGRYVVIEAKGGRGQKGATKRGTVPQFSPEWFKDRIDELRLLGQNGLADDLDGAWRNGRIEAYEVYVDTEATALDTGTKMSEKRRLSARERYLENPEAGNLGKGRGGKRAGRVRRIVNRTADWSAHIRRIDPLSGAGNPPGQSGDKFGGRARATANTATPTRTPADVGGPQRRTTTPDAPARSGKPTVAVRLTDTVADSASVRRRFPTGKVVRAAGGFIAGLVVDYVIASIVAAFEREIAETERPQLKRRWRENVYATVADKVQAFVDLEPHVPVSGRVKGYAGLGPRQYIHVRWEILSRLQANDVVSDTAVWLVKFAAGSPGFVILLEDVRPISHRITPVDQASSRPRRYYDRKDEWLLHQERDTFILVWSADVHRLANRYRATRHLCWEQIARIEEQMEVEIADLSRDRQERIRKFLITEALGAVHGAVTVYDFEGAKKGLRRIRHVLNGQFVSAGLEEYRIERVRAIVDQLRRSVASRDGAKVRKLEPDERALLGAFLGQDPEHL
jgi:hypothetical protein